jgi:biopolymer transport protein ExbD
VPRKRRRKEEAPVEVNLPITPMLDMSFQLLNFFIFTFHPMPQEGQLSVNLPKVDSAAKPDEVPVDESEQKDEYTITVISNSTGRIASISMKGPAVDLGTVKEAQLSDQLKSIAKSTKRGPSGVSITLEASPDLVYAQLIYIMDLCKRNGFDSVSLKPLGKNAG